MFNFLGKRKLGLDWRYRRRKGGDGIERCLVGGMDFLWSYGGWMRKKIWGWFFSF